MADLVPGAIRGGLPRWKARPLVRALVYSSAVAVALAYVSYRFIWAHHAQVEIRLTAHLESLIDSSVRVKGARYRVLEGTRATQIDLGAPRAVGAGRVLARLRGVHVDAASIECGRGDLGTLASVWEAARSAGVPRQIVVCGADLVLVHREDSAARGAGSGAAAGVSDGWSVAGLVRPGAWQELLRHEGQLLLRDATVELRRVRRAGADLVREVELRDLIVELGGGRLHGEVAILEGRHWVGGQADFTYAPGAGLVVRGRLESLDGVSEWLPFLPAGLGELVAEVAPGGAVTLELQRLEWGGASDVGAGGGPRIDATVRHWGSTLRVPRLGVGSGETEGDGALELHVIDGRTRVRATGHAWGAPRAQPPARGGRGGQRGARTGSVPVTGARAVTANGSTRGEGDGEGGVDVPPGELRLEFASAPIGLATWTRDGPRGVAELASETRLAGSVGGTLRLRPHRDKSDARVGANAAAGPRWAADVELTDLVSKAWPQLRCRRATVRLGTSGDAEAESTQPFASTGRVELDEL